MPRSSRRNRRIRSRGRGRRLGAGLITTSPLGASSATRTSTLRLYRSLLIWSEDRRDRVAEQLQDGYRGDRDERQDQRILHHRLTLFVAQGRESEIQPGRNQLHPLHSPTSRLPLAPMTPTGAYRLLHAARPWTIADRFLPQASSATLNGLRPSCYYRSSLISLKIDETECRACSGCRQRRPRRAPGSAHTPPSPDPLAVAQRT